MAREPARASMAGIWEQAQPGILAKARPSRYQTKGEKSIMRRCKRTRSINLEKVLAALNATCPSCGYSISPAEILRIDFERQKCPKSGLVFAAKAGRKTDQ